MSQTGRDFSGIGVWSIAGVTLLVHLAVAGRYDFFRNELYFIICGRHPDFGYVDQPPLIPLLAAATQAFGEHLWLLRLPAVLAAAALVPVTAALARALGGGDRTGWIAGLAAALPPALIALTSTLGTPTLEPVIWTLISYLVLLADVRDDRRALLWAGLVAGVALEIKYSAAIWLLGLVIGMAASDARRLFARREFWMGALIALGLAGPSLIWQQIHGWPFLFIITHHQVEDGIFLGSPLRFLIRQALGMNIALAPLWIAGLVAPFLVPALKPGRILAIASLVAGIAIYVAHGKNYYLFPVFPSLFAVGAAACSRLRAWMVAVWMTLAVLLTVPILPVVLPIYSPRHLERYLVRTHLAPPPEEAAAIGAPITHIFSDEFPWRDLERQVASVYHGLSLNEQAHTAVLASNYGEAAAVDVLGMADRLPPTLSGQNQYFLWGTRGQDGHTLILVGRIASQLAGNCQSATMAGHFGDPYAMPYERNQPIILCRNLKPSLGAQWSLLRRFQ
jgi:4-amino-4-deoxy-L-arabinose transferase-like glycosyltransferase